MELRVTFTCDSKQKIVTMPHSPTSAKIVFPKYERSYEIKPSAVGYAHKIVYSIPDSLDVLPRGSREQGGPNTYDGVVKHALVAQLKGKRIRNIAFE